MGTMYGERSRYGVVSSGEGSQECMKKGHGGWRPCMPACLPGRQYSDSGYDLRWELNYGPWTTNVRPHQMRSLQESAPIGIPSSQLSWAQSRLSLRR